ncbi:MAG TPA: addiction module antidote protein [bacterium]|nr:addiction module antidote protein [bacterium]
MPRKNYDVFLKRQLQDKQIASEYLNAALESGSLDEFLVALRNVAQAQRGIGELSAVTKLNRQSMYKMLSEDGNPTLASLLPLLKALGIRLTFFPIQKKAA